MLENFVVSPGGIAVGLDYPASKGNWANPYVTEYYSELLPDNGFGDEIFFDMRTVIFVMEAYGGNVGDLEISAMGENGAIVSFLLDCSQIEIKARQGYKHSTGSYKLHEELYYSFFLL